MIFKNIRYLKDFLIIRSSGSFDPSYYSQNYPEYEKITSSPILHYVKYGWKEGRNPSIDFDTDFYIKDNKDIRLVEINPFVHYIKHGKAEGRPKNPQIVKRFFNYQSWASTYDTLNDTDRAEIISHISTFTHQPLISIVLPVIDPSKQQLQEVLDAVYSQLYPNWELCISASGSIAPKARETLDSYDSKDARIKITYIQNGGISTAFNTAWSLSSGEFISFIDINGLLREHALYMSVYEINQHPEADIIYSDEDSIGENGKRYSPFFKPDWDPDLFNSRNLLANFTVYRAEAVQKANGIRKDLQGEYIWDLAMRIIETIPPVNIIHTPFVLYHNRPTDNMPTASSDKSNDAKYNVLESHFKRLNHKVSISIEENNFPRIEYPILNPNPLVSVIIPTKNQFTLLKNCIDSISKKTHYSNYEIIVVDNQSDEPEIISYFNTLRETDNISVVDYNHRFNYSAINNLAVNRAKGEILIFLNNDVEVISPDWMREMTSQAIRPSIGAVGALLYYNDDTVQHAGVILGVGEVADHVYIDGKEELEKIPGAFAVRNYSSVTGACMAIERAKFYKVGRFNEKDLPIAFNDVDLCLRLLQNGYRNLWTPYSELYHYESASRGYADIFKKRIRFNSEINYMKRTWGQTLMVDRAFNPNFSLSKHNYSLAFPPRIYKPWRS